MYWAKLGGPLGTIGHQQFDGQLRLAEPSGGVQSRGDLEAQVFGVQPHSAVGVPLGLDLGRCPSVWPDPGRHSWPGSPARDGPGRGFHRPAARRRPRCPGRPAPRLGRESPSFAGRPAWPRWPAGRGPRPVSSPRPSRSSRRRDNRRRASADARWPMASGKSRAGLVVVGDDQVDAQLAGQDRLLRRCRCRNPRSPAVRPYRRPAYGGLRRSARSLRRRDGERNSATSAPSSFRHSQSMAVPVMPSTS